MMILNLNYNFISVSLTNNTIFLFVHLIYQIDSYLSIANNEVSLRISTLRETLQRGMKPDADQTPAQTSLVIRTPL